MHRRPVSATPWRSVAPARAGLLVRSTSRLTASSLAATSLLAASSLLAAGCGGGDDARAAGRTTSSSGGEEYTAAQGDAIGGGSAIERAEERQVLAPLTRSGRATVQDEEDASWRTPLPPTESPLDVEGRPSTSASPGATATTAEVCPADLPGLAATARSIPRGGALVITTDAGSVDELRARLARFAALREARAPGASAGGAAGLGDDASILIGASDVRVVDVPRGARIEVRVEDESHLGALRAELREDADALRDGRCPLAMQIAS